MLGLSLFLPQAFALAPITPSLPTSEGASVQQVTRVTPKAEAATLSIPELKTIATDIAIAHGLNVDHFLGTIGCESQWDIYAKGDFATSTGYTSFGLAQLHYPTRDWGIATSTAYEPRTALEMMASAWDRKEQARWTCWRKMYGW